MTLATWIIAFATVANVIVYLCISQQVKEQADRLRQFYQEKGYYAAQVIPVIKRTVEERASVIFFIQEGEKAKIRKVVISGNKTFPGKEIKKGLATQEYSWWSSWFTSTGYYKQEDASSDVERIKEFYLDRGYLQVVPLAERVSAQ